MTPAEGSPSGTREERTRIWRVVDQEAKEGLVNIGVQVTERRLETQRAFGVGHEPVSYGVGCWRAKLEALRFCRRWLVWPHFPVNSLDDVSPVRL